MKSIILTTAAIASLATNPAAAQIGINLGTKADINTAVNLRIGDPYTYRTSERGEMRTYYSGRWYSYEEPRHEYVYDTRYGGYDCYNRFSYSWDDGRRARFEAYWCFDDRGREYEVKESRVIVRID